MDINTESNPKSSRVLLAFVLASALVLGAFVSLIVDVITNVPDFKKLRGSVEVSIKLANKEKSTKIVGPATKEWVPVSQISNYTLMAIIASEDASFFSHDGVDFHELKEAIKKDWKEKRWARGASTITQQVIKNVYLSREKTLWRKFKEFFWARELDKVLSKSEILNFYVNLVEWGPGIYGIRNASRHYFSVSPSELTARQSAFLAMLLPSPIKYHSYFRKKQLSEWATKRVNRILEVMLKMGFIDEENYQRALEERLWGTESVPFQEVQPPSEEEESKAAESLVPPPANASDPVEETTPAQESTPTDATPEESPAATDTEQ